MTAPTVLTIETTSLGDRSYLVHDGEVAFVVDPQRDVDRVLSLAEREGVRVTHVFETHIHNDYLTGGLVLAETTGASYHVNAADPVSFERTPISDTGTDLVEAPGFTGHVLGEHSRRSERPDQAGQGAEGSHTDSASPRHHLPTH